MARQDRGWDVLGIVLALAGLGWMLWTNRHFFHDDAYISLRYARHLADHGVLEWNLGERVEGYTNFLHVILTAGLIRLGQDPVVAAQSLNAAAALLLVAATTLGARRVAPANGPARMLALATLGLTPGLAIWVLGGLEAVPLAACLAWGTLGLMATTDSGRTAPALLGGLAFSLAVLMRMDSAVFIAAAGLAALLFAPGALPRRFALACLLAALPAAVAFGHMAWRLEYYGLAFPLTFYAKTGVPLSLRLGFVRTLPVYLLFGVPMLLLALPAALAALALRVPASARALALPLLLQSAYMLWSGGDHMPAARVAVPMAGAAALMLIAIPRAATALSALAAALTLAIALLRPPLPMDPAAFVGTIVGRHLATWPAGQTIALATAGSTPFHADGHVYIDQLGLNDPVIARREDVPLRTPAQLWPGHGKGDGAYILSRKPDAIILGYAEGNRVDDPKFLSDVELGEDPEFRRCYAPRTVDLPFGEEMERRNPGRPNPITFTWYARTCPD
ncbi:hypothetical protein [Pseudooceanicola sp. LIPI14-2-Ac024]|uniref:hypothetical protein n=1 Tax=Pseudooceanicola sp. LIPI14-2-Ac024 TaxID=3344875 RepID=UPI0035CEDEB2